MTTVTSQRRNDALICRFYYRFVRQGNAAEFISSVADHYSLPTLHRLVSQANAVTRRGAVLAITFLGREDSLEHVGPCLRDNDRAVRLIAHDGIRSVWNRAGSGDQCLRLQAAKRHNSVAQFEEAIELIDSILDENPRFAEAWYQRGLARFAQHDLSDAIDDHFQALECNSFHFTASLALGHCYSQMDDPATALSYYQWAVHVHPDLEFARLQVRRLEKILGEHLDH